MTRAAIIDFETRSTVNLKSTGVGPYAQSATTEALMIAWNWSDRPQDETEGCLVRDNVPLSNTFAELADHVRAGGPVVAHNASFELNIWAMLHDRLPNVWPMLSAKQTHDTMALGRALALPGALDKMARALRLPVVKDDEGHKLMLQMCKPRKPLKGEDKSRVYWHESPEQTERLFQYCKADIVVERRLWDALPRLNPTEREVWEFDATCNRRGIYLDLESVDVCAAAVAEEKKELDAELARITSGAVKSAGAKAFPEWLQLQGLPVANMRKDTVKAALAKTTHPLVKRALEIRQITSKASTAKLTAMRNRAMGDGRARGLLSYHGAATGRWAGQGIQPQNMPRTPDDFGPEEAEDVIAWLQVPGGADVVKALWGSVHAGASFTLRSLIKAAPGATLFAADYSNIEGRAVAWLADEHWKLDAFRSYDLRQKDAAGNLIPDGKGDFLRAGPDLYIVAVAKAMGLDLKAVTKAQRQIGKVMELALQYQGAHGAYLSMAKGYELDLSDIMRTVRAITEAGPWDGALRQYWQGARENAEEVLEERRLEAIRAAADDEESTEYDPPDFFDVMAETAKKNRHGLDAEVWAALRIAIDGWRGAHEGVTALWKALERAAVRAVENPGGVVQVSKVSYVLSGDFLMCRLPSGRYLAYPYARTVKETRIFKNDEGVEKEWTTSRLVFEGVDGKTKRWGTQRGYGGLLLENISQAVSRDLLADAMLRLEKAGYMIVLHVHDEAVAEMPIGLGSLDEFCSIMRALPPWAAGLPVDVAGWEGERYRK